MKPNAREPLDHFDKQTWRVAIVVVMRSIDPPQITDTAQGRERDRGNRLPSHQKCDLRVCHNACILTHMHYGAQQKTR